jgi:hypothetical protein
MKARCYWEKPTLEEHIENLMGTHWELEREHVRNKGKRGKILVQCFSSWRIIVPWQA